MIMNTHERFLTVVRFLAQIYSAGNSTESTKVMQESLYTILQGKEPISRVDWHILGKDVTRILKVWLAKENDPVAQEVANQIADLLQEFDSDTVTPRPTLTVIEYVHPPVDVIQHVHDDGADSHGDTDSQVEYKEVEEEGVEPELEDDMTAKEVEEEGVEPELDQISVIHHAEDDTIHHVTTQDEEEEEVVDEEVVEEEVVEVVEEVVEEEEVDEEEVVEEEVDEEEEVVEPEEEVVEEEESDAMEVEQITIRGRQYWLETNTKKIYAVVDEDDVGDEVGEMVANKPRFYAK